MAGFYEFFAGGGMARAGLGADWQCLFANDFDPKKAASYAANWGADHLHVGDVAALTTDDLPGEADLVWASFPCQDLSLAGIGIGLKGERSGAFWPFWKLIDTLGAEGRAPRLVVLENVCGALSAHDGKDFAAIGSALSASGYRFGAVVMNAIHFLPQSRPRLFIIGVLNFSSIPHALVARSHDPVWHPPALVEAYGKLPASAQNAWAWWRLLSPPVRTSILADVVEDVPQGIAWHTPAETQRLLDMMNPLNLAKVEAAQKAGGRRIGTIYKRTRADGAGGKRTFSSGNSIVVAVFYMYRAAADLIDVQDAVADHTGQPDFAVLIKLQTIGPGAAPERADQFPFAQTHARQNFKTRQTAGEGFVDVEPAPARVYPALVTEPQAARDDFYAHVPAGTHHRDHGVRHVGTKRQAARLVLRTQRQPDVAVFVGKEKIQGRRGQTVGRRQKRFKLTRCHQPPGTAVRPHVGDQKRAIGLQLNAIGDEVCHRPCHGGLVMLHLVHPHHAARTITGVQTAIGQRDHRFRSVQMIAQARQEGLQYRHGQSERINAN